MKKTIVAVIALLVASAAFTQPERDEAPPKPPPAEKRWEMDSKKMKNAGIPQNELNKIKPAFMNFYKEMDALVEKNKGARPPREQAEKVLSKRRDAVKKVLSAQNYKLFADAELTLGPKRKQGPPPSKQ